MSYQLKTEDADEALLREALADPGSERSRQAASQLLGRYKDAVYQWCFRYVRDHDGAMDLAQDVLLRAYRKLDTFEGRSRFSTWLFAVTRSTCLNAVQSRRWNVDSEYELESLVDHAPGPDKVLEMADDQEAMLRVMAQVLDPQEQEAMVMRYFECLPPDEITRLLALTNRTGARGLLQRARRKLTDAIANDQRPEATDG